MATRDYSASGVPEVLREDKIHSCRNFNPAFIEGSQNLRASSFKDHAATDMHKRAMILFHKSRSTDVAEYAPIARALSTLDPDTASKLKRKFEVAYLICKEGLAFTKMSALCELEEKHRVDLGAGYKNNHALYTCTCMYYQEPIRAKGPHGLSWYYMMYAVNG